jgi:hypothetical protein
LVFQRVVMQEWLVAGQVVSDNVVRSQSGRVVKHISTMSATTYSSTYGYDTAGRLVSAVIPGHELTYSFASSGGCGPNTAAGMSGNRTGSTDVWTAPGQAAVTTTTSYCYDWADRLSGTDGVRCIRTGIRTREALITTPAGCRVPLASKWNSSRTSRDDHRGVALSQSVIARRTIPPRSEWWSSRWAVVDERDPDGVASIALGYASTTLGWMSIAADCIAHQFDAVCGWSAGLALFSTVFSVEAPGIGGVIGGGFMSVTVGATFLMPSLLNLPNGRVRYVSADVGTRDEGH